MSIKTTSIEQAAVRQEIPAALKNASQGAKRQKLPFEEILSQLQALGLRVQPRDQNQMDLFSARVKKTQPQSSEREPGDKAGNPEQMLNAELSKPDVQGVVPDIAVLAEALTRNDLENLPADLKEMVAELLNNPAARSGKAFVQNPALEPDAVKVAGDRAEPADLKVLPGQPQVRVQTTDNPIPPRNDVNQAAQLLKSNEVHAAVKMAENESEKALKAESAVVTERSTRPAAIVSPRAELMPAAEKVEKFESTPTIKTDSANMAHKPEALNTINGDAKVLSHNGKEAVRVQHSVSEHKPEEATKVAEKHDVRSEPVPPTSKAGRTIPPQAPPSSTKAQLESESVRPIEIKQTDTVKPESVTQNKSGRDPQIEATQSKVAKAAVNASESSAVKGTSETRQTPAAAVSQSSAPPPTQSAANEQSRVVIEDQSRIRSDIDQPEKQAERPVTQLISNPELPGERKPRRFGSRVRSWLDAWRSGKLSLRPQSETTSKAVEPVQSTNDQMRSEQMRQELRERIVTALQPNTQRTTEFEMNALPKVPGMDTKSSGEARLPTEQMPQVQDQSGTLKAQHGKIPSLFKLTQTQIPVKLAEIIAERLDGANQVKARFLVDGGRLGPMEIRFQQDEAKHQVVILVESEHSKFDLQRLAPQIQENLAQKGMQLSELEVEVRSGYEDRETGEGERAKHAQRSEGDSPSTEETSASEEKSSTTRDYGYNTMEVLA